MQRHEEGGSWEIGFATDGPPLVHHWHNNVARTFVWWATTGNRWHSVPVAHHYVAVWVAAAGGPSAGCAPVDKPR